MPTSVAQKFLVKCSNAGVDPLNFQEFGIEIDSTSVVPTATCVAQILAYFMSVAAGAIATNTHVESVSYKAPGNVGFIPQPFPVTAWAALVALNPDLGAASTYAALEPGTGGLAPLGTSIVVTEYSAVSGPKGRGRHFLPFINQTCLDDVTGFVNAGNRAAIEAAYNTYVLNTVSGNGSVALTPVIASSDGDFETVVTNVVCQQVLSNLKSRRH